MSGCQPKTCSQQNALISLRNRAILKVIHPLLLTFTRLTRHFDVQFVHRCPNQQQELDSSLVLVRDFIELQ